MFSISVFSKNNFKDIVRPFDPERPWAGKYRLVVDKFPLEGNSSLCTTCYTYSKPVKTDAVKCPFTRISYYAYAGVHSLNDLNDGDYSLDVEVPFKAQSIHGALYDGQHFDSRTKYSTNDLFRGKPNIGLCEAKAKIEDKVGGNSSESDISKDPN